MIFRNFFTIGIVITLMGITLAQIIGATHRTNTFSIHERALENYSQSAMAVIKTG